MKLKEVGSLLWVSSKGGVIPRSYDYNIPDNYEESLTKALKKVKSDLRPRQSLIMLISCYT